MRRARGPIFPVPGSRRGPRWGCNTPTFHFPLFLLGFFVLCRPKSSVLEGSDARPRARADASTRRPCLATWIVARKPLVTGCSVARGGPFHLAATIL